MKTIYKYQIKVQDNMVIEMPKNAEVLTLQTQNFDPFIWVLVDTANPTEQRHFRLVGTGHSMNNESVKYIGTFQMRGGAIVFHLFEVLAL